VQLFCNFDHKAANTPPFKQTIFCFSIEAPQNVVTFTWTDENHFHGALIEWLPIWFSRLMDPANHVHSAPLARLQQFSIAQLAPPRV